jgi:hypothetical protein
VRAFAAGAYDKLLQIIKGGPAVHADVLLFFAAFVGLMLSRGAFAAGTDYHLPQVRKTIAAAPFANRKLRHYITPFAVIICRSQSEIIRNGK